jgi:hypothetical protein
MNKRIKRAGLAAAFVVAGLVILLAGVAAATAAPAAAPATASAAATPTPSPTASPVVQVERNGVTVKAYTLDQIEAMTPFPGFAGYTGKAAHGPDAVTGAKVTDILADALGTPLTAVESVDVAELPLLPDGYLQNFTGAQLLDPLTGFTLYDAANTANAITPTGTLAAALVYTDTDGNVMPADAGPLRFLIVDATNENGVMTGKYSVSQVNQLNVIDNIRVRLGAKRTSVMLGRSITFGGVVKNAVAKDTIVKLRLVRGTKYILKKTARITSSGAFKLKFKTVKAGKWTFVVTYKAGRTFLSNEVKVTVKK